MKRVSLKGASPKAPKTLLLSEELVSRHKAYRQKSGGESATGSLGLDGWAWT